MKTEQYDVDYFINKFSAIPDEQWCAGIFESSDGRRCAFGHCGYVDPGNYMEAEASALSCLFLAVLGDTVININDHVVNQRYQQRTPRTRILAALHDIKAKQQAQQPVKPPVPQSCTHLFLADVCVYCSHVRPAVNPVAEGVV